MTEITISPLVTSKFILDKEFNIIVRKTNAGNITSDRYVVELHFNNVETGCLFIMKQYKEDAINKDVLKFCNNHDIEYKIDEEILIPSFFFAQTNLGANMIEKWKKFFCNYELSKENILNEKKALKPVPKYGILAFSHMLKMNLRKKLIAKTRYKILLKKNH